MCEYSINLDLLARARGSLFLSTVNKMIDPVKFGMLSVPEAQFCCFESETAAV